MDEADKIAAEIDVGSARADIAATIRAYGQAERTEERERIMNELRARITSPYSERARIIAELVASLG